MKPLKPRANPKYKPKARVIPLSSPAWRRLRAQVIAEEPLCGWCLARGLYVPSTDVDHINNDGDDNRRQNLTGMCHSCHSIKTAQDMGKGTSRGHDLNGLPLDPAHPWNAAQNAPKQCSGEKSPAVDGTLIAPDLLFHF
ncbi:TPA: HNH endonuclease signature motif containing protein [Pseudomonas putida]